MPDTWVHKSAKDLEAAGFKPLGTGRCRGPKCRKTLFYYLMPNGRSKIAINPGTWEPHWMTCDFAKQFRSQRTETEKRNQMETAQSQPSAQRPTDPVRAWMEAHPLPQPAQGELF